MSPGPRRIGVKEALTGPQKCAVLCMALGPKEAAKILQQLNPDEVEMVTREIVSMEEIGVDTVRSVLQEFERAARSVTPVVRGGPDYAQEMLEAAVGAGRAGSILQKVQDRASITGMERFRKMPPEILAGILKGEHPQTSALIMAQLDVKHATRVLQQMDSDLAGEVLYRVARMDKIAPEVMSVVESGLKGKTDISLAQEMTAAGGPETVAKVLNQAGAELENKLLETINKHNADVAAEIKSLMFVFEDLLLIDAKGIQRILREIDTKDLALAFKAASEDLKTHIKSNMSERAASALDEEVELLGPVRVRDVEGAHGRIIEVVRQLDQSGEITVRRGGGSDDVIA